MGLILILLPAVYALADAFAGGSLGQWAKRLDDKLPGRAAFWGALLGALVGFLTLGPWGAAMGLVWLIYRTPGWRGFGGSATPVGAKEVVGTLLRHMLALLALLPVYWAGKDVLTGGLYLLAYALGATALAIHYGNANRKAQQLGQPIDAGLNTKIELFRGALFGVAVALALG